MQQEEKIIKGPGELHENIYNQVRNNKELINAQDEQGMTCLHRAVAYGYDTMQLLPVICTVSETVDFTIRDKTGSTPLHHAVKRGDYQAVQSISGCYTVLFSCLNNKKRVDMRTLHDIPDVNGGTALIIAAWQIYKVNTDRFMEKEKKIKQNTTLLNIVSFLLKDEASPDLQDSDGNTALHYLASAGVSYNLVLRDFIKEFKMSVSILNKENKNVVSIIKARSVDKNKVTAEPLVQRGDDTVEVIKKRLKEKGCTANNFYPLHTAIALGCGLDVLEYLIEDCGIHINCRNQDGFNALHVAVVRASPVVVKFLLLKMKDSKTKKWYVNEKVETEVKQTALRIAAEGRYHDDTNVHIKNRLQEIVDLLLEAGADPNIADENGETMLHFVAQAEENPSVILRYMRDYKADAHCENKYNGDSPLQIILRRTFAAGSTGDAFRKELEALGTLQKVTDDWCTSNKETKFLVRSIIGECTPKNVKERITEGLFIDLQDHNYGWGSLHRAVLFGRGDDGVAVLSILLDSGINYMLQDNDGNTALHLAVDVRKQQSIRNIVKKASEEKKLSLLLRSQNKKGQTALCIARKNGDYVLTADLLGKDHPDVQDDDGNTVLHREILQGTINEESLREHILRGASSDIKNKDGNTVLDLLRKQREEKENGVVVEVIKNYAKDKEDMTMYVFEASDGHEALEMISKLIARQEGTRVVITEVEQVNKEEEEPIDVE